MSELPLTITIRHDLERMALLDLRDQIMDLLEDKLGIKIDMTIDGTEVSARHEPTTKSMMKELFEMSKEPVDEDFDDYDWSEVDLTPEERKDIETQREAEKNA